MSSEGAGENGSEQSPEAIDHVVRSASPDALNAALQEYRAIMRKALEDRQQEDQQQDEPSD